MELLTYIVKSDKSLVSDRGKNKTTEKGTDSFEIFRNGQPDRDDDPPYNFCSDDFNPVAHFH